MWPVINTIPLIGWNCSNHIEENISTGHTVYILAYTQILQTTAIDNNKFRRKKEENNTNLKSRNAEICFGQFKKQHTLQISKKKVYKFVNEVLMIYSFAGALKLYINWNVVVFWK